VTNGPGPAPAASQWTAEANAPAPLAAELIRGQFPDLAARHVTMLAAGWDNTAFAVDGRAVAARVPGWPAAGRDAL